MSDPPLLTDIREEAIEILNRASGGKAHDSDRQRLMTIIETAWYSAESAAKWKEFEQTGIEIAAIKTT